MHYEQYHALTVAIFNEGADRRLKMIEVGYRSDTALRQAESFASPTWRCSKRSLSACRPRKRSRMPTSSSEQEIAERERLIGDLDAFA